MLMLRLGNWACAAHTKSAECSKAHCIGGMPVLDGVFASWSIWALTGSQYVFSHIQLACPGMLLAYVLCKVHETLNSFLSAVAYCLYRQTTCIYDSDPAPSTCQNHISNINSLLQEAFCQHYARLPARVHVCQLCLCRDVQWPVSTRGIWFTPTTSQCRPHLGFTGSIMREKPAKPNKQKHARSVVLVCPAAC